MAPKHDDTKSRSSRPECNVLKGTLGRASGGTFEESRQLKTTIPRSSQCTSSWLPCGHPPPLTTLGIGGNMTPSRPQWTVLRSRRCAGPYASPCTSLRGGETRYRFCRTYLGFSLWKRGYERVGKSGSIGSCGRRLVRGGQLAPV